MKKLFVVRLISILIILNLLTLGSFLYHPISKNPNDNITLAWQPVDGNEGNVVEVDKTKTKKEDDDTEHPVGRFIFFTCCIGAGVCIIALIVDSFKK